MITYDMAIHDEQLQTLINVFSFLKSAKARKAPNRAKRLG